MGYGDYIHWTSIIKHLYDKINNNFEESIKQITSQKLNKHYCVKNIKFTSHIREYPFKFHVEIKWKGNVLDHKQAKFIFHNNPKVIKDEDYPNIIFLLIVSDGYLQRDWKGNIVKLFDECHVVETYKKNLGFSNNINKINNFSLSNVFLSKSLISDSDYKGEFFFTEDEIKKVNNYKPNKKFIIVEPQNHKNFESRNLSFNKIQEFVNIIKEKYNDKLEVIQISPSKFADKESKFLDNCIVYNDIFTYRETILFGKYAELALVPHGGLSIGFAAVDTKVLAIYPCIHRVAMTTYDTEIPFEVSDGNHYTCFLENCEKCKNLRDIFDREHFHKVIEAAENILDPLI